MKLTAMFLPTERVYGRIWSIQYMAQPIRTTWNVSPLTCLGQGCCEEG